MTEPQLQQIANEYYEIIDKPAAAKQAPTFALCMIGLVGAGKTTVLKKLCRHIPMVRASGDEVRKLLHDRGLPPVDSITLAAIGRKVVHRLSREGYRIAYDNDFSHPEIRAGMLEHNRQLGTPVLWIKIASPEAFIIDKLRNHEPTYLFRDAEEAVANYHKRKALHTAEAAALSKLPYLYTFDASLPDLDEQVTEAARKIMTELSHIQLAKEVNVQ